MTASLETLAIAAYVFADSLSIPGSGPPGKVTDKELIALAVAQAATGLCSDRQFLGVIARLLGGGLGTCPTSRNTTAGCAGSRPTSRRCS